MVTVPPQQRASIFKRQGLMVKEAVRREPLDPKRRLIELRRRRGLRCAVRGEVKDSRGLMLEQDTLNLAHARPERPGWIASPVAPA